MWIKKIVKVHLISMIMIFLMSSLENQFFRGKTLRKKSTVCREREKKIARETMEQSITDNDF